MKTLYNFVHNIDEHVDVKEENFINEKFEPIRSIPKLKSLEELDADENDSGNVYDVEPPTEDDILEGIDPKVLSHNKKRIFRRLDAGRPFFVQGEAGWGKTSIITDVAHKLGYTVMTVYLDKCEATDLGGQPVPMKTKSGIGYVSHLMPEWARVIWGNPDVKFLLFFDEMNQAQPDVMNALMPIVLKNTICGRPFKNFVVGAAGNFEEENEGGINELSGPLLSRFGGIIKWESGDWNDAFTWLHKKFDDKLSKELVDEFEKAAPELFKNPRDITNHLLSQLVTLKEKGREDEYGPEDYLEDIVDLVKYGDEWESEAPRSAHKTAEHLAEAMFNFMSGKSTSSKASSSRRKDENMLSDQAKGLIKNAVLQGFITDPTDGKKYGFCPDNINVIVDICQEDGDEVKINAEMLQREIKAILAKDGNKWRFNSEEEYKKAGYLDPLSDD